jgi:hypothetical protein
MLLQQYNKSRNLTGMEAAICRFLPVELASLLVTYVAFIRPARVMLASALKPDGAAEMAEIERHWLFVRGGKRMTDEQIRSAFSDTLSKHLILVNFSGYR